jgi:uncharacterized membrane protein
MSDNTKPKTETPSADEAVWTYRGYRMKASEFNTALVHFYRAEVQRANTWRNRLDTTTNWAIVLAGTAITFTLSDSAHHHALLLLTIALTFIFLFIEARRYRYFELWSYRIRLIETDYYAAMLVPPFQPSPDWAETLADSLLRPRFPISMWEAIGRRFRRNYLAIFAALIVVWLFKLYIYPTPALDWSEVVVRASIGLFAGESVLALMIAFALAMLTMGLGTTLLQEATGEVLSRNALLERLLFSRTRKPRRVGADGTVRPAQAWQRPSTRREEYLTLIITDQGEAIAERVLKDMQRGVTKLHGEGMYTHQTRAVLLCALTTTEIEPLKRIVRAVDPKSFVVVMPAEVAGLGFVPLEDAA